MSALSISNIPIRQDNQERYLLNDLHKAAGNENKHRPSEWLRNKQTVELIQEIEKAGIPAIQSKQQLGTYAVKELVYAYAMWVSPIFHLHVIRAYDALATVQPPTNVPLGDYTDLQAKHDNMQAELLELYRFKIATLESQLKKPQRNPNTPLTADEKAEILRLHGLGFSRSEIVEKTGRSDTSVYFVIRNASADGQGGAK